MLARAVERRIVKLFFNNSADKFGVRFNDERLCGLAKQAAKTSSELMPAKHCFAGHQKYLPI